MQHRIKPYYFFILFTFFLSWKSFSQINSDRPAVDLKLGKVWRLKELIPVRKFSNRNTNRADLFRKFDSLPVQAVKSILFMYFDGKGDYYQGYADEYKSEKIKLHFSSKYKIKNDSLFLEAPYVGSDYRIKIISKRELLLMTHEFHTLWELEKKSEIDLIKDNP